jgi:hypothetical protein
MSDLLLEWMSFRRSGDLADVPSEFTASTRVQRIADDLSMAGHLEMTAPSSWRIAPPVLAGFPGDAKAPATAILCGARTAGVLARLDAASAVQAVTVTSTAVSGRPSIVSLTGASSRDLIAAADRAGLRFQRDAAFTLLACLPTIRQWPRTPCPMVAGRVDTVHRFSRSKLEWVESSLAEATQKSIGLFRIKRDWDWVTILKSGESQIARIDDRAGRFIIAAKRRDARWDANSQELSFPLRLYPPAIVARAFVLCTGVLPIYKDRRVVFGGITPSVLKLALAVTGLRLA